MELVDYEQELQALNKKAMEVMSKDAPYIKTELEDG